MVIFELIYNLSLLVAISVFSGFLDEKFDRKDLPGKILNGILFGVTAIIGMLNPFELEKGLFFDGRTIVISLCTLFFGPLSGFIASVPAIIYRALIGGIGVYMGIGMIISAYIIGYVFWRRRKPNTQIRTIDLYLFGLLVHLVMLLLIFTLPAKNILPTFKVVSLAIIIVFPLISLVIAKILYDQEQKKNALNIIKEKEKLFRTTLYSIGDAVITTDIDGNIQQMNHIAERLTGWQESEAKNKPLNSVYIIYNEETHLRLDNPLELVLKSGSIIGLANHTILISKFGKEIPIADSGAPIINESGTIIGIVLIFRDQTTDREKQRLLEESESRLKRAEFIANAGNWELDLNTGLVYGSEGAQRLYGIKETSGQLSDLQKLTLPGYREQLDAAMTDLIKNNKPYDVEFQIRRVDDDELIYVHSIAEYQKDKNKIFGFIEDITEYKKIIKALEQSEERYRLIAQNTADTISVFDLNLNFKYLSPSITSLLGYTPEELVEIGIEKILTPESYAKTKEIYNQEMELEKTGKADPKRSRIIETEEFRKDGTKIFVEGIVSFLRDNTGKPNGILAISRDITERKLAEEALKESEELFRNLAESTATAIFIYQSNNFVFVNKAAELLCGYSNRELLELNFWDVVHPDYKELIRQRGYARQKGENIPSRYEFKLLKKNGQEVWIDFAASKITWKGQPAAIGSAFDITDKKIAEIKLKNDEQLFRTISTLTTDYLFSTSFDEHGKMTHDWVGGAFEKLTGYTFEEYQRTGGWLARLHPDDIEQDKEDMKKLFNNQNVITQVRTIHKNGNVVWVRIYAKPVWDYESNRLIAIHGAVQDISEEKSSRLVQQIQYNIADAVTSTNKTADLFIIVRKELSKLINTKNFYVAFYDEKTGMLTANHDKDERDEIGTWPAEKSLTGYLIKKEKTLLLTKNEILEIHEKGFIDLIGTVPEIWLGATLKIADKVIGAMVVQSYDNPYAYNESSQKVFEVIANQLSLYIQRKKAEEELSVLARAIYQSPMSIFITDTKGKIVYVNPKFSETTGYLKEEIIGKNSKILSSKHHPKEFYKNIWQTILSGNDWEGELLNKKKNGELYWVHEIISPVITEDGITTHFVALKEDITEKKKMFEEILNAKEKAEASEKLKSEFLAQISHEIRTPINIMTSNVQLIKDEVEDKIDNEILELFSGFSRASHRIIRTIDLILNMSELQTGAYNPNMKKINLDLDILQTLQIEYAHLAKSKKLLLEYRCLTKNTIVTADEYSVSQIFANLIDNAIKYTDEGKVEIILKENQSGETIVEVADTGIGISEESIDKIFEPFVQEEHGYTRTFEGNGLGLALVKNYCSLNNAVINVDSEKGSGSTFRVTFKK